MKLLVKPGHVALFATPLLFSFTKRSEITNTPKTSRSERKTEAHMKIKGAELKDFIKNGWPDEDYYWETDAFEDTPGYEPVAGETYDTDVLGPLFWQGKRPDPTGGQGLDLARAIRAWRKSRDTRVVVIRVPQTLSDSEIRTALKPLKGRLEK
jgi:hypothetical protein